MSILSQISLSILRAGIVVPFVSDVIMTDTNIEILKVFEALFETEL